MPKLGFNPIDLATKHMAATRLHLEHRCLVRELTGEAARPQVRFNVGRKGENLPA